MNYPDSAFPTVYEIAAMAVINKRRSGLQGPEDVIAWVLNHPSLACDYDSDFREIQQEVRRAKSILLLRTKNRCSWRGDE